MKKGLFIVFEGIDGSGKTTQVNKLAEALSEKGLSVVLTRDPGGTPLSEELRNILLWGNSIIAPKTEAFLYAAARAQMVADLVIPALKSGRVIISDRFADSTFAYQGAGRGLELSFLEMLNNHACQGIVPDITVLLDIDPRKAALRRDRPKDRIEAEGMQFLQSVRQGYLTRAAGNPDSYLVVDASLKPDIIFSHITAAFEKLNLGVDLSGELEESH